MKYYIKHPGKQTLSNYCNGMKKIIKVNSATIAQEFYRYNYFAKSLNSKYFKNREIYSNGFGITTIDSINFLYQLRFAKRGANIHNRVSSDVSMFNRK